MALEQAALCCYTYVSCRLTGVMTTAGWNRAGTPDMPVIHRPTPLSQLLREASPNGAGELGLQAPMQEAKNLPSGICAKAKNKNSKKSSRLKTAV